MSGERHEQPEQEISIKRRGHDLFVDETAPSTGPTRPFAEFLKETPASPLPAGLKAALWALSIVAALLFAAALWRLVNRPTPKPAAATRKTRPKSAPKKTQPKKIQPSQPNQPKKTDADDHGPPPIARLSPPTDQETRR